MSSTIRAPAILLLTMLSLATAATAVSLCNISSDELDECRPAVSGLSPSEPTVACCSALEQADLPCLCSYRSSPLLPSFGIDPDLAMQLPRKCSLSLPPDC
ncbi:putative lipid-transfer protein DIR1 [Phalaenopsis equestris]|uniref:putative lipid-transfer protein DIR1 n=1 Tax=Phalaenopsis equestris TaxID=78828 RepID=UPI0009E5801E|nr:putative lipid-transfer protein DIR1 [Phalaenopsis equestris]